MYSCTYICTCVSVCIHIYVCMYACMYVYTYVHILVCIYTHIHKYHANSHTYLCFGLRPRRVQSCDDICMRACFHHGSLISGPDVTSRCKSCMLSNNETQTVPFNHLAFPLSLAFADLRSVCQNWHDLTYLRHSLQQ